MLMPLAAAPAAHQAPTSHVCAQSVKPIGTKRKNHKYGVVVAANVNLPKHVRVSHDQLHLVALYNTKFAKKHGGVVRMLTGVSDDGTRHFERAKDGSVRPENTLAYDHERGIEGVPIELPNDETGGTKRWVLEMHSLGWTADLLGAGGLGPFPEGFTARHPCRDCWWHTGCWCAYARAEELQKRKEHELGCRWGEGGQECHPCRTAAELDANQATLRSVTFKTKVAREEALRMYGVNTLYHVVGEIKGECHGPPPHR